MERDVQAAGNRAEEEHRLPPSDKRASGKQEPGNLPVVFCFRDTSAMGQVASMGGVLIQYVLSLDFLDDFFQSVVWKILFTLDAVWGE